MRRALLTCLLTVAAAGGASAVAAAAAEPPSASLGDPICHKASDALDRAISITAQMRWVKGAQSLALRFELQRRLPHRTAYFDVHGGDLGHWRPAPSTVKQGDVWRVIKEVVNLVPAHYRFRVSFRWSDLDGRALEQTALVGPVCNQPQ